jgi:hypothetical protein
MDFFMTRQEKGELSKVVDLSVTNVNKICAQRTSSTIPIVH